MPPRATLLLLLSRATQAVPLLYQPKTRPPQLSSKSNTNRIPLFPSPISLSSNYLPAQPLGSSFSCIFFFHRVLVPL